MVHKQPYTTKCSFGIPAINEVIQMLANKNETSNENDMNLLLPNLYTDPLERRRLKHQWPEDLLE